MSGTSSRGRRPWLAAALSLSAGAAWPCGLCVEDQVAATYDYAVVTGAREAGRDVLFAAVRGANAGAPGADAILRRVVAEAPGVDPRSVRSSVAPPAVSFAWESKAYPKDVVVHAINRRLGRYRLEIIALRAAGDARPQR